VEVMHWNEDRTEGRSVDTVEERCQGRDAAVESARRLLAANAHRFVDDATLEASVKRDLEWSPRDPM
jgi:hypothetical protein